MPAAADTPILTIRARAELRAWLAENHASAPSQWLATYKRHHPNYLAYEPQVEELLCWGWIDSMTRALDADRSMILIAPRNPKSGWSAINKAHVERARASGAMTAAGEAKIAAAISGGMWDFLNDVDALIAPDDLIAALGDARPAQNPFAADFHSGPNIRAAGIIYLQPCPMQGQQAAPARAHR